MRISDWSSDVCSSDLYSPDDDCVLAPKVIRHKRDAGHALIASWLQLYREGPRAKEVKPDSPHRIWRARHRSEEHTSELQSLMRISYAVFCLKKKKTICQHINEIDEAKCKSTIHTR